jgi:tetratricopeptide (TPR) repeat protein
MAPEISVPVSPLSPEQRRAAVGQFERAKQVLISENYDYAIQLLLTCCKLDPPNLNYRQTLRQAEKAKYKNNLKGSRLAVLSTTSARVKIKTARHAGDHLKVLEYCEEVLASNPWDVGAQLDMAEAAAALGFIDLAIWFLFQIRETKPDDVTVNRFLARLCEKRGNFQEAILFWEVVRRAVPNDEEAKTKPKDLAASNTIARGKYEEVVSGEPVPEQDREPKQDKLFTPAPVPEAKDQVSQEQAGLLAQLKENPANWDHYLRLSSLYRRAGDLDQARKILEQGLGPASNHFDLRAALADLAIEPLRRDLARTEKEMKTRPRDEELKMAREGLVQEINSHELELYRQRVENYPGENSFRLELGVRLQQAGKVDEAIRELQTVRHDPRYQWRALLFLGYAFKNRNYWRLAQGNFEEALKKMPSKDQNSRKEILLQLALVAEKAGDLHKAVEWAYELANLDFNYGNIGSFLDQCQARLNSGTSDSHP